MATRIPRRISPCQDFQLRTWRSALRIPPIARETVQTKFVSGNIARVDLAPLKRAPYRHFQERGPSQSAAIFAPAWWHIEPGPGRKVLTTRVQAWDYLRDLLVRGPSSLTKWSQDFGVAASL